MTKGRVQSQLPRRKGRRFTNAVAVYYPLFHAADGFAVIHFAAYTGRPLSAHQPTNALSSVYTAAKTSRVELGVRESF